MKVILVNGSPHEHGCTYTALSEVKNTLEQEGIGAELFWIGIKPLAGCLSVPMLPSDNLSYMASTISSAKQRSLTMAA